MCFSATASFLTAAATSVAGFAALSRVTRRQEIPLAATPLLFGGQQLLEGALWLVLPAAPATPVGSALVIAFLLVAKVFWPIFVPMTTLLVEPDPWRRRMMWVCLAAGTAVATYFLWSIAAYAPSAHLGHGHIVYDGEPAPPSGVSIGYFVAVGLTALLSSYRTLRLFAFVVLTGSVLSYFFYWEAYSSVWCFFAAAASVIIVVHFVEERRQSLPETVHP